MLGDDCKGREEEKEVTKLGQTNETQSAIVYRNLMPLDVVEVNDQYMPSKYTAMCSICHDVGHPSG